MIFNKKRGQAALEFLTTYAWAFLVILIMVGALAYFGVLKPSKLLPDRCSLGSEITCQDYRVTQAGAVNLALVNNVGQPIDIVSITFEDDTNGAIPGCSAFNQDGIGQGDRAEAAITSCNFPGQYTQGEKGKIGIVITYHNSRADATYNKEIRGEIFTTMQ